jgi:hypothetical protein
LFARAAPDPYWTHSREIASLIAGEFPMSNFISLAALQREFGFSRDYIRTLLAEGMPCEREGKSAAPGQRAVSYLFDLEKVREWLDEREAEELFQPILPSGDGRFDLAVARADSLKARLKSEGEFLISYSAAESAWSEVVATARRTLLGHVVPTLKNLCREFPEIRSHAPEIAKLLRAEIATAFIDFEKRESVLPEPPVPMESVELEEPPSDADVGNLLHPADPRRAISEIQAERVRVATGLKTRNLIDQREFLSALEDHQTRIRTHLMHSPARIIWNVLLTMADDERKFILRDAFADGIRSMLSHTVDELREAFAETESESETW